MDHCINKKFVCWLLQEIMEREVMEQELGGRNMDEDSWISPLEVLDQLIVHGHDAHEGLRRLERQQ